MQTNEGQVTGGGSRELLTFTLGHEEYGKATKEGEE